MKNNIQFIQIIITLKFINLISSNNYPKINRTQYEYNITNSYNASLFEVDINQNEKSIEIDLIQIKGNSYLHKYICKKDCSINKDNYLNLHYNKQILDPYTINNQQTIFIFQDEFFDDENEGKLLIAVYCDDTINCEYYIGTHNEKSNILIPENYFCFHLINNNLTYLFNENKENSKIYIKVMGLFGKFTINFENEDYDKDVIINGNFLTFETNNLKNDILKMNITRFDSSENPVLFFVYYSYNKSESDLMINNVIFSQHLFGNNETNIIFNYNQRISVSFESKNCKIEINDGSNKNITNYFNKEYSTKTFSNISFKINIYTNTSLNENNENNLCFIQGYSTLLDNNIDNILIINENIQSKILLEEKNRKLSKYLILIPIPYNDFNNITGYAFKIELEPNSNISLTLSIRNKNIKYSLLYSRVIKLDTLILKYCEKNDLCFIKVEIENKKNENKEIKIKMITKNELTYLEENKIITDRLEGPNLIFYKKISPNENGLITASTVNISPIFYIYFIPINNFYNSNNYPFNFENPIFENTKTNKENLILKFNSNEKKCNEGCIIFIKTNSTPIEPFINVYYKKNNNYIYIKEFTDIIGNLNFNENDIDDIFILKNYSYLTKRFTLVFDSINEKIKIEDITKNKNPSFTMNWYISNGKNFTNIKSKEYLMNRTLKITVSKINKNTISNRPYIFKIIPQKFDVDLMYITSFTNEICLPEILDKINYYQCNFFYHPIEGSFLKKFIISAFEEGYGYKKIIKINILYNNDFGRKDFDLFQRLDSILSGQISSSSSIEPYFIHELKDDEKLNENIYLFIKIVGTMQTNIFYNYLYFSTNIENDKIENIYNFEQNYFLYDKLNFTNQIDESDKNQIFHIQISNHGKRIIFQDNNDINKLIDGNFILTLTNIKEINFQILYCDEKEALVNVKIWKNNINNKYENLPFNKENKILLFNTSLPITFTIKLDYTFEFNVNVKLKNVYENYNDIENKVKIIDFLIESYLIKENNQKTNESLSIQKLELENMFIITSSYTKNETYTHLLIILNKNPTKKKVNKLEIDISSYTINRNRYYLQEKSYYYGSMNTSINNSTILFLRPILGKPITIEFSSCSKVMYSIRIYKGYSIYVKREIKTLKENLINGKLNFDIEIDIDDLPDLKIEIRALNKINELAYYVIKYRFGNPLNFNIDRQLNLKIEELNLTLDWGGISSQDINIMIKPIFFVRINYIELIDFDTICFQTKNNIEEIVESNRYILNNIDKENYYSSVIAYFIYNDNEEVLLSFDNNHINYEMKGKVIWFTIIVIYFSVFFIFSGYYFYKNIKEKKIIKNDFSEFEKINFETIK